MGDADRAIASFQEYLRKAKQLSREDREVIEGYIAEMEQLKRSRASAAATPPPVPALRPAAPASAASAQSPVVISKTTPASEPGPVYTRWWFWTAVAAVAAAGVATFVVLSADRSPGHGDLGALDLRP